MRARLGDLLDLVFELIDAFESSGIDYAFGGAIAYSPWAEPRATRDVDLNVWLGSTELERCFDVLERLGAMLELQGADFDRNFVSDALVSMLDEQDEKLQDWNRLKSRVPARSR